MDKIKPIVEQYIEWIVLGVAGLFLLLMAYFYLFQSPVYGDVAGEQLGPGDVDRRVLDDAAVPLESALRTGEKPTIQVDRYPEVFKQRLAKADFRAPALATVPIYNPGSDVAAPDLDTGIAAADVDPNEIRVPKVPPPTITRVFSGKTSILPVSAEEDPAAEDPADAGAEQAVADARPNPADAEAALLDDAVDTSFVTVLYDVPVAKLRQAWLAAGLPAQARQTMFLRVSLLRQEEQPDGSWGEAVEVPLPESVDLPAMPGNSADARRSYKEFAQVNQPLIVTPEFFEVVAGENPLDVPVEPEEGAEEERELNTEEWLRQLADIFDPTINLAELSDERRAALMQARREQRREENQRQRQGNQPGGLQGGEFGGYPGEFGGYSPDDSATFSPKPAVTPYQNRRGGNTRGRAGRAAGGYGGEFGGYPGEFGGMEGMGEYGGYPGEFEGGYPGRLPGRDGRSYQQADANAPRGMFDPTGETVSYSGWAFDTTAQAGRTYRYKVVYQVLNPLWQFDVLENAQDAGQKAKAEQFAVASDEVSAAWSEPVEVEPLRRLYLADAINRAGQRPDFLVFRWTGGQWNSHTFENVAVGDVIGGEVEGVDYATTWMLGDVRPGPGRDRVAVLLGLDGRVETRGTADLDDETREELEAQVVNEVATR